MYQKMLEETAFRVDSTWHTHKEKIQIYQQKLHPIMLVERDVEAHMRCLQYAVLMDLCVLVTCGHWDSSFALFSLKQTTNHLQSIKYHHDVVSCVCTAEDHLIDYWIVCGSRDCTISVWKLENDRCTVYSTPQHVLSGHVSAVTAVAASALLDVVVSGDASGMILVHHLRSGDFLMGLFSNGKILPELNPMPSPSVKDLSSNQSNHKRRVTWLGLSWKGFIVVYEASKYRLTTFSMTGRRLAQIIVLEKLNAFVFSKNGDVLITGGSGGLVVFRWVSITLFPFPF